MLLVGGLWLTVSPPTGRPWQLLLAGVCVLAVLCRRRFPVAAVVLAALATAAAWVLGATADPCVLVGLCLFAVAERHGQRVLPWWLIAIGGVVGLVLFVIGAETLTTGMRSLVLSLVVLAAAWALGTRTRQARQDAASRARAEERLRLTREVHDVLSHSLGTIRVQAGVAAHVDALDAASLRGVLREVESDARASLTELAELLRRERDDGEEPQAPHLADELKNPARALERAGIRAAVDTDGDLGSLPVVHRQTIARHVREATTNVIHHSGASACRISIAVDPSTVSVTVADDGHGVRGGLREGHGLAGMRERVALLDGAFTAGDADDGFAIAATLPLPSGEGRHG